MQSFSLTILSLILICFTAPVRAGPPCTRLGRECVTGASCVNRQCVCPEKGEGIFECADEDEFICQMLADPHLIAYGGARGGLHWPCRYRLSRFVTELMDGTRASGCSFEVFGISFVTQSGRYYAKAAEVSLSVIDLAQQIFMQTDIIKFDINELGISDSMGGATEWGTGVHGTWNNITIRCDFDEVDGFAILNIPRCNVRIKFRPRDPDDEPGPQRRMPGISIVAGKDTRFGITEQARFPDSLCGETARQGDGPDLFEDCARDLGLEDVHECLLYQALQQNIIQETLVPTEHTLIEHAQQCSASIDNFEKCGTTSVKAGAIRVCVRLVKWRSTVRCLTRSHVLNAFNLCLRAYCKCNRGQRRKLFALLRDQRCRIPRRVRRGIRERCPR